MRVNANVNNRYTFSNLHPRTTAIKNKLFGVVTFPSSTSHCELRGSSDKATWVVGAAHLSRHSCVSATV